MENIVICYGHLVYLHQFGIFYGHRVKFVVIWYISSKKNLTTLAQSLP
jgi:hypothetical protein